MNANESTHELLSMKQAAALVGKRRQGRPTSERTVGKWCRQGLCGIKLRCLMVGGYRYTKAEWLREFFEALTAARAGEPREDVPTPAKLGRRYAGAKARNERAGIR